MELAPAQLAALVAIADHGTFEAAARHLHVTPSAVSQRIRALESEVGQVVVRRTTPCRPTPAGEVLLRLARQTRLLHDEVRDALAARARRHRRPAGRRQRRLAGDLVPRGARSRWPAGRTSRCGCTSRTRRSRPTCCAAATCSRAVTSRADAGPGLLGRAARPPALRARPPPRRSPSAGGAAAASTGRRCRWWSSTRRTRSSTTCSPPAASTEPPVVHRVPTSADFLEAVCLGLGWGMLPQPQLARRSRRAGWCRSAPALHVDVALHWQRWRLDSPVLDRLTDAVRRAARAAR